ncbi:MAG: TIGR02679 domain-containing protein [Dorea formicigenerans]
MNESEQEELEKIKKECLAYFGQSPVWKKVLRGFREKYSSYGRFGGKVVLKNLKSQDIEELEGFFGKSFHGQKSVTVSAEKFRQALEVKPLQKYDTGMAVRKLFRRTIAWKTGTKTFKATGKRKNMGKFPKELRRDADRDGGRIIEKYRQRQ